MLERLSGSMKSITFKNYYYYYSTDEDPSLRIESSAIINLRGVSTKLNKYMTLQSPMALVKCRSRGYSIVQEWVV